MKESGHSRTISQEDVNNNLLVIFLSFLLLRKTQQIAGTPSILMLKKKEWIAKKKIEDSTNMVTLLSREIKFSTLKTPNLMKTGSANTQFLWFMTKIVEKALVIGYLLRIILNLEINVGLFMIKSLAKETYGNDVNFYYVIYLEYYFFNNFYLMYY